MYRIMANEIARRSEEDERQAELIKALSEQIVELQTALLEYQEAAWLLEELELAAGCDVVVINRVDGCAQLIVRGVLWQGPTLREVAVAAFEKESAHGN
jgi:hypothetical protein